MTQQQVSTDRIAEAILAASPQASIYADRAGIIQRWNVAAETLFGYAADQVLGHSLDVIIPEHLRQAHWQGFNHAMNSGVPRLGPGFMRTKAVHADGNAIYVELSFRLIKDDKGDVIGAVAFCRNC